MRISDWSSDVCSSDLFYDYLSPFVMASAVCAFNVLYGLGTKAGEYAVPLKKLSACTLGVYCLHNFVLNEVHSELAGLCSGGSSWWSFPPAAVAGFGLQFIAYTRPLRFKIGTLSFSERCCNALWN